MYALASQAFTERKQFDLCEDFQARANMMRIAHVELFKPNDTLLVLGGYDCAIARTIGLLPNVAVAHTLAEAAMMKVDGGGVVAIGTAAQLQELSQRPDWPRVGRLALCWQDEAPVFLPEIGTPVLRGWWHGPTGALISTEFPNPPMPAGDEALQHGTLMGSLGRLLPGIAYHQEAAGLRLSGLAPNGKDSVWLEPGVLDDVGFVTLVS